MTRTLFDLPRNPTFVSWNGLAMRPQNSSGRASIGSATSSVFGAGGAARARGSTLGDASTSSSNYIYLNNQEAIPLENLLPAIPTRFSSLPAALSAVIDFLHAADSASLEAEHSSASLTGGSSLRTIRFSLPGGPHAPEESARAVRAGGDDRSLPASAIPVRFRQLADDGTEQSSDHKPSSASTAVVYVRVQVHYNTVQYIIICI